LAVALAASGDGRLYLAGLEDGLVVSSDAGATWQSVGELNEVAVFGLSVDGLYAASALGVFQRHRGADAWERVDALPARAVCSAGTRALALGLSGELRGGMGGTWRSLPVPDKAGTPTCIGLADDGTLVLGTSTGVWRLPVNGIWRPVLGAPVANAVA